MSDRGRLLPPVIAFLLGVAAWHLALWLVRDDLVARQAVGDEGRGPYRFVVALTLGTAALAYWSTRRLLFGPKLTREDWALYHAPGTVPSLDALIPALERHGYRPTLAPAIAARREPVWLLRHVGRRHGGVTLDLRSWSDKGIALVEAADTRGELYQEMAKYAMYELGRLIPGITYRGAFSSLSPESTDTLEPQLPDRPHALRQPAAFAKATLRETLPPTT
jgi:hypothetical protein